ncbi:MAG: ABC transporter permease, partial [Acetatifactor sp.]|nr:ABC transporter permease [Acetatifactor sp.]
MTWPFENDTGSAIRKLATKNLKTDKTRNTLLVITIALATCLILSAILYFGGSKRASLRDAAGRYQASIPLPDAEAARTLENDSRITAGFSYLPGMLDYGDYKVTLRSIDENLMMLAKYPAMEGKLPETVNEVAVTQAFLTRENLQSRLGDTLLLDLGDGEQPYRICGILPDSGSNYSIYISAAYAQGRSATPLYIAYIHVPGTDGWPEDAIKAQILDLSEEWGIDSRNVDFSTYYLSLIRQRSAEYMSVIALIVLTVTLACALVIYSLFFISVTQKTKEYGRLRAIGATGRQVRKMVFQEGRRLSARAIPIGLVTGTAAGYALVPRGWNLPMPVGAGAFVAALMYLCVMLTVSSPARTA